VPPYKLEPVFMAEFDAVELEPMLVVEFDAVELEPVLVELVMVELALVELESASAVDIPATLIKIPNNISPLALIFTIDEFVFLYISNY
jgi:hypothetical protein